MSQDRSTLRILAGVSYDETGENAMRMAVDLARYRPSAMLHVAHVAPDSALASRTGNLEDRARLLGRLPEELARFTQRFLVPAVTNVAVHVRVGDPASTLLQLAADYDADLVVVGTHGRRGLQRFALGSVAQALLDARRCPIVIAVPSQLAEMHKTVVPAPECPDCASLRASSGGRELWCAKHQKVHLATSLRLQDGAWVPMGGLDPGLVP